MKRAIVSAFGLLAACTSAASPVPAVPLAEHWSVSLPAQPAPAAPRLASAGATSLWDRFQSDELRALQRMAAQNSPENLSAAARIAQQVALARVASAPLYPTLSATASFSGQSQNGNTLSSIAGAFVEVGLAAQYNADLWGRTRSDVRAAQARSRAFVHERADSMLTVDTAVAQTYFEILALRERSARGQETLVTMRRILELIESKLRAGTALVREVAQQKALVAAEVARVEQLAQLESDARVSLAVVAGSDPIAIEVRAQSLDDVLDPALPLSDIDVPERLLTRRPDVARAEAQLAAADADVDRARAALLPQLSLVGSAAYQSIFLSKYYDGSGIVYAGRAQLTEPIIDGGARAAECELARTKRAEAEAQYRRVALLAVGEVERALRALDSLGRQREQRQIVVEEARRAFGLIEGEYRAGVVELLAVLDGQRTLLSAEDELSQVRLERLRAAAQLTRALGGGWSRDGAH